jgi:hypothetical protein
MQKYTIPRFHNTALVVLTYGPFDITARQLSLSVVAVLVVANLWPALSWFSLMPALLVLPFGWISIAGRPLEVWGLLLLRYWFTPRIYEWQRPVAQSKPEGEEQ